MQLHLGRSDFATQAQAQSFCLANDPANDPHRLDDDDNVVKRVRLLGIDTPERSRFGYRRATDSMRTLTPVGTSVTLVSDPSQDLRDRYGRLLGYVMRNRDGRDMNLVQLARGMARVYVTPTTRSAAWGATATRSTPPTRTTAGSGPPAGEAGGSRVTVLPGRDRYPAGASSGRTLT